MLLVLAAAKQVGLRGGYPRPEGLGKLMMLSAKEEKGKTFENLEYM
jgi:hypothetical protein